MTGRYTTGEDTKTDKMDPPMLGIPRDTKYRECFDAEPGNVLVWADYSQIELRILAELSGEENLIRAFVEDKDLHIHSAVLTFQIPEELVTKKERDLAKDLNYGLVYGVGSRRFAQKALIEVSAAQGLINRYFKAYPRLKSWLDDAAWRAVMRRQAITMGGRLVKFNFNEKDPNSVALTQRNGKNTPIQGTGADMLKVALWELYSSTRGLPIKMIHAVHDEIIVETPESYKTEAETLIEECMVYAGQKFLKHVPVKVDVKSGPHWMK